MEDEYNVEIVGGEEPTSTEEVTEEQPEEAQPGEAPVETPTEQPQTQLVKMPDGRELPPEAVVEEYKKLQSDYTRKSQELSNYKTTGEPKPYESDEYDPSTWKEVIEYSKKEALEALRNEQLEQQRQEQELDAKITAEVAELKQIDPNLDENKLFAHAAKWKFSDLKTAFENMREINTYAENVKKQTIESVQKRASDPVAGKPKQVINESSDDYYEGNYQNMSLVEALREIKNNK